MILKGKIVTLRPIEREDLEFVRGLINDPELENLIVGWAWPISKKDEEQWYASFHNNDSAVRYIIETESDGVVGLTGLVDIDWKNGSANDAGIRIKQGARGRGFGMDTYMTLFRFAFDELRLNRISVAILFDNVVSLSCFEKLGCKREGVSRKAVYKNGVYKDLVRMGILAAEYRENVIRLKYWD